VYLFTSNEGEPGALRDTFIVACSLQKLDFEDLYSSGGYWHTGPFAWTERDTSDQPHDFGEMPSILQLARNHLLTDNFAPRGQSPGAGFRQPQQRLMRECPPSRDTRLWPSNFTVRAARRSSPSRMRTPARNSAAPACRAKLQVPSPAAPPTASPTGAAIEFSARGARRRLPFPLPMPARSNAVEVSGQVARTGPPRDSRGD